MEMSSVSLLAQVLTLSWVSLTSAQTCLPTSLSASSIASYLTSPNYPSNYPPSITCQWTITAQTGYVVELTFVTFDTEGSFSSRQHGCSSYSDNLEIYDGEYQMSSKLLGKYCTNYLPSNVYSSGRSLLLRFKSDSYEEKTGFKIKYIAVLPKKDPNICTPFNTFSENNAIKYTGSSGYIKSPLYGTKYPSNIQCTWVIKVPEDKKVKLSFSDFKVVAITHYVSSSCSSTDDHLEIRDGRYSFSGYIDSFCSSVTPAPQYSTGRYMWIRFKSNSDNLITSNSVTNGFKAKFEAESTTSIVGIVAGVIFFAVVVFTIIAIYFCCKRKKRFPGRRNMPPPTTQAQTTVNYNQNLAGATPQYPGLFGGGVAPPPPVGYSPVPQGSYPPPSSGYPPPPPGSYPPSFQGSYQPLLGGYNTPSTGGGTPATVGYPPQSSIPMKGYPSQTIPDDPPPQYPGSPPPQYPGSPPPQYPGAPPYPQQAPTAQQQAAPYPGPQGASVSPNPPYPLTQGAEHQ